MKILLMDNDPHMLDALSVGPQLQWQDCKVTTSADGKAGEQAFVDHDPDVVVLDVAMPGKSGFEVLQAIRRVSDAPVLMVTARGEVHDQVRGLEPGAVPARAGPLIPRVSFPGARPLSAIP